MWALADVTPADVKVAQLYDAFSPLIPLSLEGYGFCARGEGGPFTDNGNIEWPNGRLPVNTAGGGMSEAYVHGFNLVLEGVRQIRGTSTSQVDGADVSLVTSGEGVPTSRDPVHEGRVTRMETGVAAARSRRADDDRGFWDGTRARRAARAGVRRVRAVAHAAAPDVPALPVDRRDVGADVGPRARVVVHRAAPAAAARVRRGRAVQRDRRRARRGSDDPLRRQPRGERRRRDQRDRSRRRSRSASRCASCSTRSTTSPSPAGCACLTA